MPANLEHLVDGQQRGVHFIQRPSSPKGVAGRLSGRLAVLSGRAGGQPGCRVSCFGDFSCLAAEWDSSSPGMRRRREEVVVIGVGDERCVYKPRQIDTDRQTDRQRQTERHGSSSWGAHRFCTDTDRQTQTDTWLGRPSLLYREA